MVAAVTTYRLVRLARRDPEHRSVRRVERFLQLGGGLGRRGEEACGERVLRRAADRGHAASALRAAARRRAAVRLQLGAGHTEADLVRDVARHTDRSEAEVAALVGSRAPAPVHDHDLIRLANDLAGLDREVRRS